MRTAGFVLTGGQSSRMRRDKALLPLGDSFMAEAIAATLAQVTGEVFLVGRPERYGGMRFPCLADLRPDLGPLSGLETALASKRADLNVVLSCDLAGLQASWIVSLLHAMQPSVLCAAAVDQAAKVQPLCAVYRSNCLPFVTRALNEGRLKAKDLLAELGTITVPVDAIIPNLNTPEQYTTWLESRTSPA